MKIADLQQTLHDLCRLLRSAGTTGSKVDELAAFADGLDTCREQTLKAFITNLSRPAGGGPAPRSGRRQAAPGSDPDAVASAAKSLYERAAGGIDESELIGLRDQLTGLKKDGLKVVAAALDYRPTAKENTNPKLIAALCALIEKRAGASIRRNLINRPALSDGVPVLP